MDFLQRHRATINVSPLCICLDGTEVFRTDILAAVTGNPWWASILPEADIREPSRQALVQLLEEFASQFDVNTQTLGRTHVLQHSIDTGDTRPIRQAPRRIPVFYQKDLEEMIRDMLNKEIIRPSSSPWASPIVLVKKKDGSLRLCVDYRRLNAVTKRDSFPLPRIDDTIDAVAGAKWFSTLDLASGYWQVDVHPTDRPKTAFVVPSGLYEFNVMPFGLANAPATFQRLMTTVLRDITPTSCLIYLDDIIVHGTSIEDHNAKLRAVLSRLKDAGLVLRTAKCKLLQKQTLFLGHIVSASGIRPDPSTISRILEWPTPRTTQEVRSFVGLASYYRKFVRGFAGIAAPLHRLTEKSRPFLWTNECEHAFTQLKQALTSPPILSLPDVSQSAGEFILDTDASDKAIGAVLSQKIADTEKVIAFASRKLSGPERKYSTTKREMLALVFFVKYFRPYLLGRHFLVRTDHSALQWLQNFREPEGQIARWQQQLQEYDYTCTYRPGCRHLNADGLSRRPDDAVETVNAVLSSDEAQQWATLQAEDTDFGDIYNRQLHGSRKPTGREMEGKSAASRALWGNWAQLRLENRVLFLQARADESPRLVLPKAKVAEMIEQLHHQLGHAGQRKTEAALRRRFWWPTIHQDVASYCRGCLVCAQTKPPTITPRARLQPIAVDGPNHRIGVDIIGPLSPTHPRGNQFILVIIDYFTKWVEAIPLKSQDAKSVATAILNDWVSRYGAPEIIHSDRGTAFENHLLAEVCSQLHIKRTHTTPYHPEGNGLVERTNRTIKKILTTLIDREAADRWDEHLSEGLLAYRASVHDSTGFSPALLQLGHELRLPADLHFPLIPAEAINMGEYVRSLKERLVVAYRVTAENIQTAQQRQKSYYDRHAAGPEYHVGDSVLLFRPRPPPGTSSKFHRPWQGPYTIVFQPSTNTFVLRDPQNPHADVFTVHYNQIKPAPQQDALPGPSLSPVPPESLPPIAQTVEITSTDNLAASDTVDSVSSREGAM